MNQRDNVISFSGFFLSVVLSFEPMVSSKDISAYSKPQSPVSSHQSPVTSLQSPNFSLQSPVSKPRTPNSKLLSKDFLCGSSCLLRGSLCHSFNARLFYLLFQPLVPHFHSFTRFDRKFNKLQFGIYPLGIILRFFKVEIKIGQEIGFVDDTQLR